MSFNTLKVKIEAKKAIGISPRMEWVYENIKQMEH